jgi:hypothetical protein
LQGQITPYLTPPGQANPYAQQIQSFIQSLGTTPKTTSGVGTQDFNPGQDALMQMMRSSPAYQRDNTLDATLKQLQTGGAFDTTQQFNALGAQSDQDLARQVAQLHASAGSLGQRFGTANQGAEALLRSTATTNLAAQRAQIAQAAYNQNQATQLSAAGLAGGQNQAANQFLAQIFGQQIGAAGTAGGLAQQGRALTSQEQQFNQSQNQQGNQFLQQLILSGMGQAAGIQQAGNQQNIGLLSLLAGQQAPQAQPSALPGAVGDLSQFALLWPFLQKAMGGAGAAGSMGAAAPAYMPNQSWTPPPMNWRL